MNAQITVIRTPGEIEHSITLEVSELPDGTIEALPVETVCRQYRYGPDWEGIHMIDAWTDFQDEIATEGKDFELTDDELEEARKAIASNQAAYDAQMRADLNAQAQWEQRAESYKGGISPLAGLNPPNEKR